MTLRAFSQLDPSQKVTGARRVRQMVIGGLVGTASLVFVVGGMGGVASAAPGDTSNGSTIAKVGVSSSINLNVRTGSFTLNGLPGAIVTGDSAVTMSVVTNNLAGYNVTVESASATLDPALSANSTSIPIAALGVRAHLTTVFTPLSSATPVVVHTQPTPSDAGGDTLINDYQVVIPFVSDDTYTATLNYVATCL